MDNLPLNESFKELIDQAHAMLLDRQKWEADLIYYVCKLPDEVRAAIILAYQNVYLKKE